MKIAICDDEQSDLKIIDTLIRQYNCSFNITLFHAAKDLLSAYEQDFFDLVFLDIEMEKPNGYKVAKLLIARKEKPLIVFVTNSSEYTLRGYGVAFRYLTKPVDFESISNVLNLALELIVPQKIPITVASKTMLFSIHDIYYVEVVNHNIIVATKTDDYQYRGKLKDIEAQLPSHQFVKPHNSFIVNLAEVAFVTSKLITLTNGKTIPISQRSRKQFELSLAQYVRR